MFTFYAGFEKMERGLSEKYHDRVSPVKRHMDHMVSIGAAPGLINPQLNTMTSDVVKVREGWNIYLFWTERLDIYLIVELLWPKAP